MVHFDFIGGCVLKNQIVINQLKNPILIGMFQQKKQTGIRGEISGWEFDFIDQCIILTVYFLPLKILTRYPDR